MPMTVTAEDELPSQIICSGIYKGTITLNTITPAVILTMPTTTTSIYRLSVWIMGFRTDLLGQSWSRYSVATFFNNAGSVSQTGSTSNVTTDGTGGQSSFSISGTNVQFLVNPSSGSQTWNFTGFLTYYKGV